MPVERGASEPSNAARERARPPAELAAARDDGRRDAASAANLGELRAAAHNRDRGGVEAPLSGAPAFAKRAADAAAPPPSSRAGQSPPARERSGEVSPTAPPEPGPPSADGSAPALVARAGQVFETTREPPRSLGGPPRERGPWPAPRPAPQRGEHEPEPPASWAARERELADGRPGWPELPLATEPDANDVGAALRAFDRERRLEREQVRL